MNIKTVIASVFRVIAIMLVLAVLLPSVTKLTHAFNHHQHEVCETDNKHKTHFHESDLNCDFYKFKLTKTQFIKNYNYEIEHQTVYFKPKSNYYTSIYKHQQLTRFLRGPPTLV